MSKLVRITVEKSSVLLFVCVRTHIPYHICIHTLICEGVCESRRKEQRHDLCVHVCKYHIKNTMYIYVHVYVCVCV